MDPQKNPFYNQLPQNPQNSDPRESMADVDDCSAAAAAVVPSELSSTGAEEVASAAELDLGLTLRTSKLTRGSRMACRILTAEDLGSRSPISSSSSVSSSSSAPSPAGAGGRTPPSHCHGWAWVYTCSSDFWFYEFWLRTLVNLKLHDFPALELVIQVLELFFILIFASMNSDFLFDCET